MQILLFVSIIIFNVYFHVSEIDIIIYVNSSSVPSLLMRRYFLCSMKTNETNAINRHSCRVQAYHGNEVANATSMYCFVSY